MADKTYDVVIVGSGITGTLLAKVVAETAHKAKKNVSILILEAGRHSGLTQNSYDAYLQTYYAAGAKTPNAPYPNTPNAPAPSVLDIRKPPSTAGYFVQEGPLPFSSNNTRALGGTTLHWLGISLRMLPNDFRMQSQYGQGVDWPITYTDLKPYYEMAEWEIGVSANVKDQLEIHGVDPSYFGDYHYPMYRIPPSYLDKTLSEKIGEMTFEMGDEPYDVRLISLPQGRNSIPNPNGRDPRSYLSPGDHPYQPFGAADDPVTGPGQRCEGNASCIPICPPQAKYSALKTIAQLEALSKQSSYVTLDILSQAVVSQVGIDPDSGRVSQLTYKRYENDTLPCPVTDQQVRGNIFVLAAHAIENAKLLLASRTASLPNGIANHSDMVGRNLMDHPFMLTWGLMPESEYVGPFRGPGATSGIPIRDGGFRQEHAAFRTDVGNWGWNFADQAPYRDVERQINPDAFRTMYRNTPQEHLLPDKPLFGSALRRRVADVVQRQIRFGFLLEQLPNPENRVTIEAQYKDQLGLYRPVLHYDVTNYTRKGFEVVRDLSRKLFQRLNAVDYTQYKPTDAGYLTYNDAGYTYFGSGHLVGTHRMGDNRDYSVVNRYQRSWDHDNLYIIGCGSMPTIGTSNPTLTAAALSLMSAEQVCQDLGLS